MDDEPDWENPALRWGGKVLHFGHLGGTNTKGDPDSWYPELWVWIKKTFKIQSMLDVGCGVGHCQKFFSGHRVDSYGLDCRDVLLYHKLRDTHPGKLIQKDLTTGPYLNTSVDLVWTCEVGEHIEELCVDYFLQTLSKCCTKVLAFSAAPVGNGGYHHVNCRDEWWWIDELENCGFTYKKDLTAKARSLCPVAQGRTADNYFRRSGMIFTKRWK